MPAAREWPIAGLDRKSCNLGKDVRDSGQAMHPIAGNRGKEPIIPNDVDTPTDDELSSCSSPSLSLSSAKNARDSTKARSRKRPSHHPAFSDAVSGTSRRARREAGMRQNQSDQALRNASIFPAGTMPPVLLAGTMPLVFPAGMMPPMPLVHPTFGIRPTFDMLPITLIRRPR